MESTVRVENDVQSSPAHIGDDRSAYSLGWRGQMLVVLFGLTMLLANLSVGRSMTYHEAIYSQPAREMLASGDWLIPRIAGVPFVEKPPLTTWLVACSI